MLGHSVMHGLQTVSMPFPHSVCMYSPSLMSLRIEDELSGLQFQGNIKDKTYILDTKTYKKLTLPPRAYI